MRKGIQGKNVLTKWDTHGSTPLDHINKASEKEIVVEMRFERLHKWLLGREEWGWMRPYRVILACWS